MEGFGKIIGRQLMIMFAYMIGLKFIFARNGEFLGYMMVAIFVHVLACFILAISNYRSNKSSVGTSYLVSTFIVLIIGFGSCIVMISN